LPPVPEKAKIAMPRGSKPGERRGGRQRGTPNKKTALTNAALAAAAANPEISPLEFLLRTMRDPNVSSEIRIKVAQAVESGIKVAPASISDQRAFRYCERRAAVGG
jgi:hypothetical protein